MKNAICALFLALAYLATSPAALAQQCTNVHGTPSPRQEFIPEDNAYPGLWPTGTGGNTSEEITALIFTRLRTLLSYFTPASWSGRLADVKMLRTSLDGGEGFPSMGLTLDVDTITGTEEHHGSIAAEVSSCAITVQARHCQRLMIDMRAVSPGLFESGRRMINGVAYDFCHYPDPAHRPGWSQLRTFVTVYKGGGYDDRMTKFLVAQAEKLNRAIMRVYGRAHNGLVAAQQRRERRERMAAAASDHPVLTSGSASASGE